MHEAKIRAMIVDDEVPARERIRALLADENDVEIMGVYGDALQAAAAIDRDPPDLLFLDIQMPKLDGLQLLAGARDHIGMHVVFVTAFEKHALTAFELDAADYLLKPFDPDRFKTSVERVRVLVHTEREAVEATTVRSVPQQSAPPRRYPAHFAVRERDNVVLVPTADIDWVQAMGNYVRLHVGTVSYVMRQSMQNLEVQLDPERFVRVHRSTILNVNSIDRMRPMYHGEYEITLKTGSVVMMSRKCKEKLRGHWGPWL